MKKSVLSFAMALIIAAIMSLGCFATEVTWGFSDSSRSIYNSTYTVELASISRQYSYSSVSMALTSYISVQPKAVSGTMCRVKADLEIRDLGITYASALGLYTVHPGTATSFEEYLFEALDYLDYTTIVELTNGYSTKAITISDQRYVTQGNKLYWLANNNYAEHLYSPYYYNELTLNVIFGTENTISQPHFYY